MASSTGTTSSPNAESYIGSFLSVISKSEIRYEGTLYHLDPQDSTIALKNVRSYGTEGRKTNGPQVPPNDNVYQYILFRGSDIKDLQVKTNQPAQAEEQEQLHYDPAIIQTNRHGEPSPSSVSPVNETSTDLKPYGEPSALNTVPYPSLLPHNYSTNNVTPSSGMPAQWQTPGSMNSAQQLSLSTTRNLSNQATPANVAGTFSSSPYFNASPGPASEHFHMPITTPISSSLPPYYNSTLANSNGLTMPFPVNYQSTSAIEAPDNKLDLVPKPISLLPTKSPPNSSPFVSEPIAESFSLQQPTFLTPNQFSQPRLSEYSLSNSLYSGQSDIASNSLSTAVTQGVQPPLLPLSSTPMTQEVRPPLLPLPPPSQKLSSQFTEEFDFQAMNEKFKKDEVWGNIGKANQRNNIGVQNYGASRRDAEAINSGLGSISEPKFTEEFDFQAMNEKFKKDEVWGDLGKVNQRNNSEGLQNFGASSDDAGVTNPGLVSNSEPKPSYKKDDFFDTISCNSVGRGARNAQNQPSERIKLNSETFGNFQQRPQLGHNGYGGRHGYNRGQQYHHGRGYNYHNPGRGGYMQDNYNNPGRGGYIQDNYHNSGRGGYMQDNYHNSGRGGYMQDNHHNSGRGGYMQDNYHNSGRGGYMQDNYHNSGRGGYMQG